ncbi:MAG: hypothetical protein OHK0024_36640 [Thalassobaculales bacterium]
MSSIPWSIKGISAEAREAAREAAQGAGLTMGAWLAEAIHAVADAEAREGAAPEVAGGEPAPAAATPPAPQPAPQSANEAVEAAVARVFAIEQRMVGLVSPLSSAIEQIRRRLEALEDRLDEALPPETPQEPLSPVQRAVGERLAAWMAEDAAAARGSRDRQPG